MHKDTRLALVDRLNGVIDQARFVRNNLVAEALDTHNAKLEISRLQEMVDGVSQQIRLDSSRD